MAGQRRKKRGKPVGRSAKQKEKRIEKMKALRELDHRNPAPIDTEIMKVLGLSEITLSRMRKEMGYKKTPPIKGFKSKLTKETEEWIKSRFPISYKAIAAEFDVSISTAQAWARSIGCGVGHKGKWNRYTHPKGFSGHKHSQESLDLISKNVGSQWKDPNHRVNSEEYRQSVSDRSAQTAFKNRFSQKQYSRANSGKREDLGGLYVRSTWEANYARYLNFLKDKGKIWKWEYEADTFMFDGIKRGCRFYTPDFKVWDEVLSIPYFVEVKGWMDQKSRTKLARMKKYYPGVRVDLVTEREYRALAQWAKLIPNWEYCKRSKF